jgi:hypothetical protein
MEVAPALWLREFEYFPTMDDRQRRGVSQLLEEQRIELTPEFFTAPEVLAGIASPYEFVYALRKTLESDEVSNRLHFWIDVTFGVGSALSEKVFRAPHPPRARIGQRASLTHAEFDVGGALLCFAAVDQIAADRVTVYSVSDSGIVRKTVADLTHPENGEIVFERTFPTARIAAVVGGLLLIDSESCELTLVRPPDITSFEQDILPVNFCEDNGVCFSTNGAVFCIECSATGIECFGVCKVSPQVPTCACSGTKFSVTAVGVRNGSVLLFERQKGEYLRTIAVNGHCPKRVLVTNALPFVLVQYENALRLFSIYGELLREVEISFAITVWTTFVSNDGFDFVVVADSMGRVCVMEAFFLKLICVLKCGSAVLTIRWAKELQGIIAVTQDGKGFFAAIPPTEPDECLNSG